MREIGTRNKTKGQLWRIQGGCCYFCSEEMERGPYPGKGKFKVPEPRQMVRVHLNTKLSDDRKSNPIKVAAHAKCAHKYTRDDLLYVHNNQHRIKAAIGRYSGKEGNAESR